MINIKRSFYNYITGATELNWKIRRYNRNHSFNNNSTTLSKHAEQIKNVMGKYPIIKWNILKKHKLTK